MFGGISFYAVGKDNHLGKFTIYPNNITLHILASNIKYTDEIENEQKQSTEILSMLYFCSVKTSVELT